MPSNAHYAFMQPAMNVRHSAQSRDYRLKSPHTLHNRGVLCQRRLVRSFAKPLLDVPSIFADHE